MKYSAVSFLLLPYKGFETICVVKYEQMFVKQPPAFSVAFYSCLILQDLRDFNYCPPLLNEMFDQLHSKALFLLLLKDHWAWLVLQVNIDEFTLSASKYHFCYRRALVYKASRDNQTTRKQPNHFFPPPKDGNSILWH